MCDRARFLGSTVGVFYGGGLAERGVSLRTGAPAPAAPRRKGDAGREIGIRADRLGAGRGSGGGVGVPAPHGR